MLVYFHKTSLQFALASPAQQEEHFPAQWNWKSGDMEADIHHDLKPKPTLYNLSLIQMQTQAY